MNTAVPRQTRPRNQHLPWVLLIAGLCLVACVTLGGAGSGRALAAAAPVVISPREVPPLVGFVTGQVEQSSDGGATWAPLPHGSRVALQSLVRTGGDGSCIVFCSDSSLVAMKPGTTVQVLPQARELRLAVLAGRVWVRFEYAVENDRNGIGLTHATVLALGAGDFSFEATKSTSVVRVIEGAVAVVPRGGGARVSVAAAQTLRAAPSGLRPAVAFDVGLERAEWQFLLGQAGLSVTTTTLASTSTSRPLPPDGPVGMPAAALGVLMFLGWEALAILAILGTFVYLALNRHSRRRGAGH